MKKDKNKKSVQTEHNYYDLKQEAVDELVDVLHATSEEALPEPKIQTTTEKAPNPYKLDRLSKIPTWIKAFFIKFWMGGAICYFFFWGLGLYIGNTLDLVVLVGLATGLITGLLLNNAFLYFESDKKEYHPYMLIPVSGVKVWALFLNMIVGLVEVLTIFMFYTEINKNLVLIKGLPTGSTPLEVEPLLYGLLFLVVDTLIVSIKNLGLSIYRKAKLETENKN